MEPGAPSLRFFLQGWDSTDTAYRACYGLTPENVEVGVILHARDGQLSEMEIYSIAQQERRFGLPKIDTL
jgi:hypothetical protein